MLFLLILATVCSGLFVPTLLMMLCSVFFLYRDMIAGMILGICSSSLSLGMRWHIEPTASATVSLSWRRHKDMQDRRWQTVLCCTDYLQKGEWQNLNSSRKPVHKVKLSMVIMIWFHFPLNHYWRGPKDLDGSKPLAFEWGDWGFFFFFGTSTNTIHTDLQLLDQ